MDLIKELESQQMKAEKPVANVGDTVRVHVKIKEGSRERIQVFEGIVIAKKHGGIEETAALSLDREDRDRAHRLCPPREALLSA